MTKVEAVYIDARDGRPATEAPLRHGPAMPHEQLQVDAIDRAQRPARIYGRISDDAELAPGMQEIGENEHQAAVGRILERRKAYLREQAREQFDATLASGFDDGSGTVWAATEDARTRVLDLTQRIQENRAGTTASALPNGKSTVRLRDASNTPHDVGPDKIVALAEQGSDFKDAAEDRLEELLASIDAATSRADLDAIDVTAGWPG